jgi:hypothetical protein
MVIELLSASTEEISGDIGIRYFEHVESANKERIPSRTAVPDD